MRILFVLLLSAISSLLFGQVASGRIDGNIQLADGHSVPGAVILARTQRPKPMTAGHAISDKNDHFSVDGLPGGTYTLCVLAAGVVDPCTWSAAAPSLTISAGAASTGNVVHVGKGSNLRVHVSDPSQLINTLTSTGAPNHILLGVWTPSQFFFPLTKTAENATGRDYQLSIPLDTPVPLTISTKALLLSDPNSEPVPGQGLTIPVQHTTGQPEPGPLTFTVTGIAH